MLGFSVFLRVNKLSVRGESAINSILYITGKVAMALTWLALCLQATGKVDILLFTRSVILTNSAVILLSLGIVIQLIAYFYLGKDLKFGIPTTQEKEQARLKVTGLYRFSRNPMYVGFYLMVLSASLYVLNPIVWILSAYTFFVHHTIILGEEKFLKQQFGTQWDNYVKKTRRYI